MNILLTNDDGIDTEGINILYDVFSICHNVYIIAPDKEQSACSNAITVRSEISVKKISKNKFSISGFPADCVIIGLHGNLIPDVDMIISGINYGPNIGDDLFFSGTVAGARTAYIFGKTGIAISMDSYNKPPQYLNDASNFLLQFISEIMNEIPRNPSEAGIGESGPYSESNNRPLFLNVNYPNLPLSSIKGKKYTFVGRRIYKDSFENSVSDSNELTLRMNGSIESVFKEGSDATELENGFISITPLVLNCTDYSYLKIKNPGKIYV